MDKHFPDIIGNLPVFKGPFDAHQLSASNCKVLFASYPAGTQIAAHNHDTENVGIITRGQLILTMDGETRTYSVGDWYHIPALVEHTARFDTDTAEIEFWFEPPAQ